MKIQHEPSISYEKVISVLSKDIKTKFPALWLTKKDL